MAKYIGIILFLLSATCIADLSELHEYKHVNGMLVRQGPIVFTFTRVPASKETVTRFNAGKITDDPDDIIVTSKCNESKRSIKRVGFRHPNR